MNPSDTVLLKPAGPDADRPDRELRIANYEHLVTDIAQRLAAPAYLADSVVQHLGGLESILAAVRDETARRVAADLHNHDRLSANSRALPDQHPITAIAGLQNTLAALARDVVDVRAESTQAARQAREYCALAEQTRQAADDVITGFHGALDKVAKTVAAAHRPVAAVFASSSGGGGTETGVAAHDLLSPESRARPEQHPITAITGLENALEIHTLAAAAAQAAANAKLDAVAVAAPLVGDGTETRPLTIPVATTTMDGLFSAADKTRLVGVEAGATKTTAGTGVTITDGAVAVTYGTTAGTAAQGNDVRLSNARIPNAHAASHAAGGSDAVTPAAIGAAAKTHAATHKRGGADSLQATTVVSVADLGLVNADFSTTDADSNFNKILSAMSPGDRLVGYIDGTRQPNLVESLKPYYAAFTTSVNGTLDITKGDPSVTLPSPIYFHLNKNGVRAPILFSTYDDHLSPAQLLNPVYGAPQAIGRIDWDGNLAVNCFNIASCTRTGPETGGYYTYTIVYERELSSIAPTIVVTPYIGSGPNTDVYAVVRSMSRTGITIRMFGGVAQFTFLVVCTV